MLNDNSARNCCQVTPTHIRIGRSRKYKKFHPALTANIFEAQTSKQNEWNVEKMQ